MLATMGRPTAATVGGMATTSSTVKKLKGGGGETRQWRRRLGAGRVGWWDGGRIQSYQARGQSGRASNDGTNGGRASTCRNVIERVR
jgi:hypothetical protein